MIRSGRNLLPAALSLRKMFPAGLESPARAAALNWAEIGRISALSGQKHLNFEEPDIMGVGE